MGLIWLYMASTSVSLGEGNAVVASLTEVLKVADTVVVCARVSHLE